MINQKKISQDFLWTKLQGKVELVYQYPIPLPNNFDKNQTKSFTLINLKKSQKENSVQENQNQFNNVEQSFQLVSDLEKNEQFSNFDISLNLKYQTDLVTGALIVSQKAIIQKLAVKIIQNSDEFRVEEKHKNLTAEILLCQKSHSTDIQRYKILKGGFIGSTKRKNFKDNSLQFEDLKFNQNINTDKPTRIMIAFYSSTLNKPKQCKWILVSKQLFLIEEQKLLQISSYQFLQPFVQLFEAYILTQPPSSTRLDKSDRRICREGVKQLEQYLVKKNRKILNVVYLSFKYSQTCQLFFKQDQQSEDLAIKKNQLSKVLAQVTKQIHQLPNQQFTDQEDLKLTCNYQHPDCKLIFKIKTNLRRVRILMAKGCTPFLNIIACDQPREFQGFAKLNNAKQIKQFYNQYHSGAKKSFIQGSDIKQTPSHQKKPKKIQEESFREEDHQEQQDEGQSNSHENYSNEEKAQKKITSGRKYIKKAQIITAKEKYATRLKSKIESNQEDSLRLKLKNKTRQKTSHIQPQIKSPTAATTMQGMNGMNFPIGTNNNVLGHEMIHQPAFYKDPVPNYPECSKDPGFIRNMPNMPYGGVMPSMMPITMPSSYPFPPNGALNNKIMIPPYMAMPSRNPPYGNGIPMMPNYFPKMNSMGIPTQIKKQKDGKQDQNQMRKPLPQMINGQGLNQAQLQQMIASGQMQVMMMPMGQGNGFPMPQGMQPNFMMQMPPQQSEGNQANGQQGNPRFMPPSMFPMMPPSGPFGMGPMNPALMGAYMQNYPFNQMMQPQNNPFQAPKTDNKAPLNKQQLETKLADSLKAQNEGQRNDKKEQLPQFMPAQLKAIKFPPTYDQAESMMNQKKNHEESQKSNEHMQAMPHMMNSFGQMPPMGAMDNGQIAFGGFNPMMGGPMGFNGMQHPGYGMQQMPPQISPFQQKQFMQQMAFMSQKAQSMPNANKKNEQKRS